MPKRQKKSKKEKEIKFDSLVEKWQKDPPSSSQDSVLRAWNAISQEKGPFAVLFAYLLPVPEDYRVVVAAGYAALQVIEEKETPLPLFVAAVAVLSKLVGGDEDDYWKTLLEGYHSQIIEYCQKVDYTLPATKYSRDLAYEQSAAPKRMLASALTWYCDGQARILQVVAKFFETCPYEFNCRSGSTEFTHDAALMAIQCQMIHFVSAIAEHCGTKQKNSDIDIFCRGIKPHVERSRIRSLATFVGYHLIQTHFDILQRVYVNDLHFLVNHHNEIEIEGTTQYFYPKVDAVIKGLAHAGASSTPARYLIWTRWRDRITHYIAGVILERCLSANVCLDVRLLQFATAILKSVHESTPPVQGVATFYETLDLKKPLPKPILKKKDKNDFAGVFPDPGEAFPQDERISIFGRVFVHSGNDPSSSLVDACVGVMEILYESKEATLLEDSSTESRKRKAKASTGRRKKRKTPSATIDTGEESKRTVLSGICATTVSNLLYFLQSIVVFEAKSRQQTNTGVSALTLITPSLFSRIASLHAKQDQLAQQANGVLGDARYWELKRAHEKVGTTLGKGRVEEQIAARRDIFGNHRVKIYRNMLQGTRFNMEGWPEDSLPFALPHPTLAFFLGNLSSETIHSVSISADMAIIDGFISSLRHLSEAMANLSSGETLILPECMSRLPVGCSWMVLAAAARLSKSSLQSKISPLISCLSTIVELKLKIPREDSIVLKLVGRSLVISTYLFMLLSGALSSEAILKHINSQQTLDHSTRAPLLPPDEAFAPSASQKIDKRLSSELQELLKKSFKLGFTVSDSDPELLCLVWNMYSLAHLFQAKPFVPQSKASIRDIPDLLVELRQDIFYLSRLIALRDTGMGLVSKLISAYDRANGIPARASISQIVTTMTNMKIKAISIVHEICLRESDVSESIVEELALSRVLCIYFSFLASCCTTCTYDFLGVLRQTFDSRSRNDQEREEDNSECDSIDSEDIMYEFTEMLNDMVENMGFVPTGPDWIDENCALRDGITYDFALDFAEDLYDGLSQLLRHAENSFQETSNSVLRSLGVPSHAAPSLLRLSLALASFLGEDEFSTFSEKSLVPCIGQEAHEFLTTLSRMDTEVPGLYSDSDIDFDILPCYMILGPWRTTTKNPYLYFSTSAKRVAGEWELLLSIAVGGVATNPSTKDQLSCQRLKARQCLFLLNFIQDSISPLIGLLVYAASKEKHSCHPLQNGASPSDDWAECNWIDSRVGDTTNDERVRSVLNHLSEALNSPLTVHRTVGILRHFIGDLDEFDTILDAFIISRTLDCLRWAESLELSTPEASESLLLAYLKAMANPISKAIAFTADVSFCTSSVGFVGGFQVQAAACGSVDLSDCIVSFKEEREQSRKRLIEGNFEALIRVALEPGGLASRFSMLILHAILSHDQEVTRKSEFTCNMRLRTIEETKYRKGLEYIVTQSPDPSDVPIVRDFLLDLIAFSAPDLAIANYIWDTFTKSGFLVDHTLAPVIVLSSLISGGMVDACGALINSCSGQTFSTPDVHRLSAFLEYLDRLKDCLVRPTELTGKVTTDSTGSVYQCSFKAVDGFQEQFWYNCFTCGLVGDRGCCTSCAIMCHRGHDVVFSRKSSFFCDCGAESGEEKPGCNCLEPTSWRPRVLDRPGRSTSSAIQSFDRCAYAWIEKLSEAFSDFESRQANDWPHYIRALMNRSFSHWTGSIEESTLSSPTSSFIVELESSQRSLRENIDTPSGKISFSGPNFRPIGSLRACSRRRAGSDPSGKESSATDSDALGRFVLIDGLSIVLFCGTSAYSRIRTTGIGAPLSVPLAELGTSRLDFEATGVALSKGNGELVLAWNSSRFAVLEMESPIGLRVLRTVIPISSNGMDTSRLMCEWLPGSDRFFIVTRGPVLHVYDCETFASVSTFTVSCESGVEIVDFTAFDCRQSSIINSGARFDRNWKVVSLTTPGVFVECQITWDSRSIKLVQTKTAGGSDPTTCIHYLALSRMLLFEERLGGVKAVCIDSSDCWDISRAFDVLPSFLDIDGHHIQGPYRFWKELSFVAAEKFFRLVCCPSDQKGRPSPSLLFVDVFETSDIRISLSSERSQTTLETFLERSLFSNGIATLGSYTSNDTTNEESTVSNESRLSMRQKIALLHSDGLLHFHEETDPCNESTLIWKGVTDDLLGSQRAVLFEHFKSLSDANSCQIISPQLPGLSSEEVTERLNKDNEESLEFPSADKSTLVVTLSATKSKSIAGQVGICAFRVAVGSSLTRIPESITVQGRVHQLERESKKFYPIILTPEEVIEGVRTGRVVISIQKGSFGVCPQIDAIEVFGIAMDDLVQMDKSFPSTCSKEERGQLEHLLLSIKAFTYSLAVLKRQDNTALEIGTSCLAILQNLCFHLEDGPNSSILQDLAFRVYGEKKAQEKIDGAVLSSCRSSLEKMKDTSDLFQDFAFSTQMALTKQLVYVCDIATKRPENYFLSVDVWRKGTPLSSRYGALVLEKVGVSALDSSFLSYLLRLTLLEATIFFGPTSEGKGGLSNEILEIVQRVLSSGHERLVSIASKVIRGYLVELRASDHGESATSLPSNLEITYRCDGCNHEPIRGKKYSFDDGDRTFDLCENCYSRSLNFCLDHAASEAVVINGSRIGESTPLLCGDIGFMVGEEVESGPLSFETRSNTIQMNNLLRALLATISSSISMQHEVDSSLFHVIKIATHVFETLDDQSQVVDSKTIILETLVKKLATLEVRSDSLPELSKLLSSIRDVVCGYRNAVELMALSATGSRPEISRSELITCPLHKIPAVQKSTGEFTFFTCPFSDVDLCTFLATIRNHENVAVVIEPRVCDSAWTLLNQKVGGNRELTVIELLFLTLEQLDLSLITSSLQSAIAVHRIDANIPCLLKNTPYASTRNPSKAGTIDFADRTEEEGPKSILHIFFELLCICGSALHSSHKDWFRLVFSVLESRDPETSSLIPLARGCAVKLAGSEDNFLALSDHFKHSSCLKKVVASLYRGITSALTVAKKIALAKLSYRDRSPPKSSSPTVDLFLATFGLVPEDSLTDQKEEEVQALLSCMLEHANRRQQNWRSFCESEEGRSSIDVSAIHCESLNPVEALICLLPILRNASLISALKLLKLALHNDKSSSHSTGMHKSRSSTFFSHTSMEQGLSAVHLLVSHIVLDGSCSEVRSTAESLVAAFCIEKGPDFIVAVIDDLSSFLPNVNEFGTSSKDFFRLVARLFDSLPSEVALRDKGESFAEKWVYQMRDLRGNESNEMVKVIEVRSSSGTVRKRFDLCDCKHCVANFCNLEKRKEKGRAQNNKRSISATPVPKVYSVIPAQMSDFGKVRLRYNREFCRSSEFAIYFALQTRLAMASMTIDGSEIRGRYAKKITVYTTSRPVSDPSVLKEESYADHWNECATVNLPRAGTKTVVDFKKTVLAANVKVEFSEFYERDRGEDDSLVYCPRCTRTIRDGTAVCDICGEVIAFQCQRCRHIDYNSTDPFLCVECGYCPSGNYSFEATAAYASNAVSVTTSLDYERMQRMLGVATRLQDDLRSALHRKILSLTGSQSRKRSRSQSDEKMIRRSDNLDLPLERLGKRGQVVKAIAILDPAKLRNLDLSSSILEIHRIRDSSRGASDGARSILLQFHRQSREVDAPGEAPPSLDEPDMFDLYASDAIGKVVLRTQRRERNSVGSHDELERTERDKPDSKKSLAVIERLYDMMREAAREKHLLQYRISAWERLLNREMQPAVRLSTDSCQCSSCAPTVATGLLNAWVAAYRKDTSIPVTREFIQQLLHDDHVNRAFHESKKNAVKEIALASEAGSELVLSVLKPRIEIMQDATAADIVGTILAQCGDKPDQYKAYRELAISAHPIY